MRSHAGAWERDMATDSTASPDSTGRHSGTQAIYPSWLLAAAALVPLLKWQH